MLKEVWGHEHSPQSRATRGLSPSKQASQGSQVLGYRPSVLRDRGWRNLCGPVVPRMPGSDRNLSACGWARTNGLEFMGRMPVLGKGLAEDKAVSPPVERMSLALTGRQKPSCVK